MAGPQPVRVLVAEDNPVVRTATRVALQKAGYELIGEAEDGEQAVQMVSALRPDVVLMDIDMPKIDGLEATRQIQQNWPTPVVILTAYDLTEIVAEASAAGAGAFVVKPLDPEAVDRAIAIATARFKDMMALHQANEELQCRNEENERLVAQLKKALSEVKVLSGLLPICSHCKKIRNDDGYWQQVDTYIRDRSHAEFSHSICPECEKEHYREFMDDEE